MGGLTTIGGPMCRLNGETSVRGGPTAEVDSVRWEVDYKRQTVCQTGGWLQEADSVSDGRVITRGRQCVRGEGDYKRQTVCQTGGWLQEADSVSEGRVTTRGRQCVRREGADGRVTTRGGQCVRREGDYKRWIVYQTGGWLQEVDSVSEGRVTVRGGQCVRREGDYKRWTICRLDRGWEPVIWGHWFPLCALWLWEWLVTSLSDPLLSSMGRCPKRPRGCCVLRSAQTVGYKGCWSKLFASAAFSRPPQSPSPPGPLSEAPRVTGGHFDERPLPGDLTPLLRSQ